MIARLSTLVCIPLFLAVAGCACCQPCVPADELAASQLRSQELYSQSQSLELANAESQQTIAGLQAENDQTTLQLAEAERQLSTANSRVENLLSERSELKDRYKNALETPYEGPTFTSDYSQEIPGFEYDPSTGLNKFPEDVIFELGSAELRPEMKSVLQDFVSAANAALVGGGRILIVGHTDDQPIVRPVTAEKHPTNWHLSTDRADAVIVALTRLGLSEEQMAAMGYSRFQPIESSTDETARRRNRRVELYIVSEVEHLAAWDPARALH